MLKKEKRQEIQDWDGGGGRDSIVEMRKEIRLKYSNMAKCLNSFVAHC